jgi:membrane-bound lytic murein transglycosylase MltF
MSLDRLEQVIGKRLVLPARLAQWELHFRVAASEFEVDPLILAAICDRESLGGNALDPKGAAGVGDKGHGRGLMQIDDRAHHAWLKTNEWRDALTNIRKGAEIFAGDLQRFRQQQAPEPTRCALAAYNCGAATVRKALERSLPVDHFTTKQDYSADVTRRYLSFKDLIG